jgi:glycosyltransferase involved in cell wall biosynthesis
LLVIGDAVSHTGFARVIRGIFEPLVERYEIFQLGVNHWGDPHDWPWPIYPAAVSHYSLGVERVTELVGRLRPDLVFILNDPEAIALYLVPLRHFEGLPVVAYAAYNAGPVEPEDLEALEGCARLVVYTEFARAAVEEARARAAEPARLPPVEVLPHGVDVQAFHPIDPDRGRARRLARERLFPENPELLDAFLVLNANRNQPRKRIDVTMAGFARFAEGRSGVYLHLHMGAQDLGWNLPRLARRLGIEDRLILTHGGTSLPDLQDSELNVIYNAADVGINTATSEGWGLVSFEQAAAGLAQIVPEHTAGEELWRGAAELLPTAFTLTDPARGIAEHLIDPAAVASALARLHGEPERLRALEQAAIERARSPRFRWPNLSSAWDRIFREALDAGSNP